jgi:hypothetical protein
VVVGDGREGTVDGFLRGEVEDLVVEVFDAASIGVLMNACCPSATRVPPSSSRTIRFDALFITFRYRPKLLDRYRS